jgi:spectinomycin phosphotransferase
MLERPALDDARLMALLRAEYGVQGTALQFLPLGADPDTAVFRLSAPDGEYFVKLRSGAFHAATVAVPHLLGADPATHVIAPLEASGGRLHVTFDAYAVMLYPFVSGRDGWGVELTANQWAALGRALRTLHATVVPPALAVQIPREDFGGGWRAQVRAVLAAVERLPRGGWPWPAHDAAAQAVVELLGRKRAAVMDLLAAAEQLAPLMRARAAPYVLCHGDIHAANVLLTPNGTLYVVDWDTVTFAPKARDLMFVGAGLGGWRRADQAAAFYAGYGPCAVDVDAIAYYRCERIVQDIAVYCRALLWSDAGAANRAQQTAEFLSQFEPGAVVEIALATAQDSSLARQR